MNTAENINEKLLNSSTSGKHIKFPLEIATLFFWFSLYTYPSVFSPYLKQLGINAGIIGIILGSYGMSQLLLRIPLGIISDKLRDRKSFIISGIVFSAISALGLVLFKQAVMIFICRMLAGVAASSWVVFSVLYSSYFKQDDSSSAISRIFIFQSSGTMIAMFIGGALADKFGWEMPFIVGVVAALISLLFAFFIKDYSKDYNKRNMVFSNDNSNFNGNGFNITSNKIQITEESVTEGSVTEVSAASISATQTTPLSTSATPIAVTPVKSTPVTIKELVAVIAERTLLVVSLLAILLQFNSTATVIGITPIYAESIGATKFQLGVLTFFSQFPVILASLLGSKGIYTKVGEKKVIVLSFFILAFFSGIIPLVKTMRILYLTQFIAGFSRGVLTPVLMGLGIKNIAPEKRATAMGAFQAIYGIGMVAGPAVFGFITQASHISVGFVTAGLVCFVASVLAIMILNPEREH